MYRFYSCVVAILIFVFNVCICYLHYIFIFVYELSTRPHTTHGLQESSRTPIGPEFASRSFLKIAPLPQQQLSTVDSKQLEHGCRISCWSFFFLWFGV